MRLEIKNIWYMLAWILIAAFIFNPTFASQISSNLVKWFVAITSSDTKAENNLVWLDVWWKLPTDVIPASAATTWGDRLILNYVWQSYKTCPVWFYEIWRNKWTSAQWTFVWTKNNTIILQDWCDYNNFSNQSPDHVLYISHKYSNWTRCNYKTTCISE